MYSNRAVLRASLKRANTARRTPRWSYLGECGSSIFRFVPDRNLCGLSISITSPAVVVRDSDVRGS